MASVPPEVLIEATGVSRHFAVRRGVMRRTRGCVRAVDNVSLAVHRGETVGLVGESGCGKTTFGRCLVRLVEPTEGTVTLHLDGREIDLLSLPKRELRDIRWAMQMVFQDPQSSLDPRMTVGEIVGEPLVVNRICRGRALEERVAELLTRVGLQPYHMRRFPHAFSGGQRQRIGIARALAVQPKLIVADEPVSALDVSIRAQILNLLADLRDEFGLSYLFVAHDLSAVAYLSDRVAVMYLGSIVELAASETAYRAPLHPYTEALLSAVPVADPDIEDARRAVRPVGEPPDPANPPSGCCFHPRCLYAEDRCREARPALEELAPGHSVACHRACELQLRGIPE